MNKNEILNSIADQFDSIIELYKKEFSLYNQGSNEIGWIDRSIKLINDAKIELVPKVDNLLYFMLEHFHECPTPAESKLAFQSIHNSTKEMLETIEYNTIPVVLVKTILGVYRMPIEAINLKNWQEFVLRFRNGLPNL